MARWLRRVVSQRRVRGATTLLLVAACGSEQGTSFSDGGAAPEDAGADTSVVMPQKDATPPPDDAAMEADAGAVTDAGTTSFCDKLDASNILLCETFDESSEMPTTLQVTTTIPATVVVTDAQALSKPHSVRVAFTDAGDYNSATGAAIHATFPGALPRVRLSFAVALAGSSPGELDVAQLTWSSGAQKYWVRFGVNGGNYWTFESTGSGLASFTKFPSTLWFRVIIEVDLVTKKASMQVGGVEIFDLFLTRPDSLAPTELDVALGVPAISTLGTPGAGAVIDDVLVTTF